MSKTSQDLPNSKNLGILFWLGSFIAPYKFRVAAAFFALIFTATLTLAIGHGVRLLIDQGFMQQSMEQLSQAIGFLLVVTGLIAIGTFCRFYLVSWLGERVSADIRLAIFNRVIELHPSYFETHASGDVMARITTDTSLLQSIIGSSFSMALRSALMLVGGIIMLIATNLKLTLVILVGVPVILLPMMLFGRRVRSLSRKSQDSMADVGSYAGEAIEQIKTVQSYNQQPQEKQSFAEEVENAFTIGRRRIKQRALLIAAVIMIVFSAISGMLWIGGNDVISGAMSGGDLAAFVFYAILVASSLATISEVLGELQRAAGAAERLVEILQVESLITTSENSMDNTKQLAADIAFDNVSFNYPSRPNQRAIDELSLSVEQGKTLALVGHSGAGKSTLFELLQRFYDPQDGAIMLGGVNIKELTPEALRDTMALVPQLPTMFSQDVMHNIRYGRPEASEEDVIEAARLAYADEFIENLPEGYKSYLGERGVRLSGGQKQRIAIARAILKDPRILLLDEATSALDSESEHQVQKALQHLMKGRTTLIIAHRLSTIMHADKIAVMDQGKVIAIGTHQKLIEECEPYQRLVELQFRQHEHTAV